MAERSLTSVPGVAVGHWTDDDALTGVTVMLFPEPNVAAVEVRGAAPGTRETAILAPGMKVEGITALVFAGGSAYGLAAADGVVAELAAAGKGYETVGGIVPIVPSAIIYDLMIGDGTRRPGPADGAAAYRAATTDPVATGSVGAGAGAVVAGWRGREALRKGGIGSACVTVTDEGGNVEVGALVVLNSVGDVFSLDGASLTGGEPVPPQRPVVPTPMEQTTLVAIATNAAAGRTELMRLAVRAHDALAVCLRPSHTRYDGDAVFAVSCGRATADPDALGEAAFHATGLAIENAARASRSAGGVPAIGEVPA